jgi:alpha-galactosidase
MAQQRSETIDLSLLLLEVGFNDRLFTLHHPGAPEASVTVVGPEFEVDGQRRGGFTFENQDEPQPLPRGGVQRDLFFRSLGTPDLLLRVRLRVYPGSPILRLQYRLTAAAEAKLTKRDGKDHLRYFSLEADWLGEADLTEYQLSHFDPVAHSYMPNTEFHPAEALNAGLSFVGPIAWLHNEGQTLLAAYEHGADHPDSFFDFRFERRDGRSRLSLSACKGNSYAGQMLAPGTAWESAWLELGLDAQPLTSFMRRYRKFFLDEVCENIESRKPNIYYNTWNYQERNRYFNGRPYLETMRFEQMMAEVEIAYRLGVDVFVIDTGWYVKTGDWQVNRERFPDGLQEVRKKLEGYGMKLGLWFNPTVAALTSRIYQEHPEYQMTRGGKPLWQGMVWETEASTSMCLASGYADDYIETMVRLHEELGVSYFKWDAVSQYGCDSAEHKHGTRENSVEERADCYAYQMGREMIRIVEEVTRCCPGVIVDFDITEGGRFVGLGFLSVGKYFLVNNGPYFSDFDIPRSVKMEPDTINVFFYPGAARPRICRQGYKFDPVVPSILFLTHYLPDAPELAQDNSLASLLLGGNGLWGDLRSLSEADIQRIAGCLADYKQVGRAVVGADPIVRGYPGSSPEVHEKIDPQSASGLVAFFTVKEGEFTHLTQPLAVDRVMEVKGAEAWEVVEGRLRIRVRLGRNEARVVFVRGK